MKKKLFYNISGLIHSKNISEMLLLFECFRNMYPCYRHFKLGCIPFWDIVKVIWAWNEHWQKTFWLHVWIFQIILKRAALCISYLQSIAKWKIWMFHNLLYYVCNSFYSSFNAVEVILIYLLTEKYMSKTK